ncbi:MAG: hypothetical protein ACOX81_07815 [Candidatus Heteroscillospira sp.]|jgi:hypothetical protein
MPFPDNDAELFSRSQIGREQLDVLLDCVRCGDRPRAKALMKLLAARLDEKDAWIIPPGEFQHSINEAIAGAPLLRYCRVRFPGNAKSWYYQTGDFSIRAGDWVLAPFGENDNVMLGRVESAGDFPAGSAPYPPEKTKFIQGAVPAPEDCEEI